MPVYPGAHFRPMRLLSGAVLAGGRLTTIRTGVIGIPMKCLRSRVIGKLPMELQPRELNTLVGCSKRLTAGRPLKVSFRARKVALCHVPEANDFGTFMRPSAASDRGCRPAEQPSWRPARTSGAFSELGWPERSRMKSYKPRFQALRYHSIRYE
jgi:hypothetical protein